jgi:hypothetical protein
MVALKEVAMFRRPVKRCWLLALVVVLLTITACGVSRSQNAIIGSWKFLDTGVTAEDGKFVAMSYSTDCECSPLLNLELHFNQNGTVKRIGSGPSLTGTYAFVDSNHIRIDLPAEPGGAPSSTMYEIIISENRLILRLSADAQKVDQRFDRVPSYSES